MKYLCQILVYIIYTVYIYIRFKRNQLMKPLTKTQIKAKAIRNFKEIKAGKVSGIKLKRMKKPIAKDQLLDMLVPLNPEKEIIIEFLKWMNEKKIDACFSILRLAG